MKVVLDTNVIISAFLSPSGKPVVILQLVLHHQLKIYFNTAILAEYEEVLGRSKFAGKVYQPALKRFFDLIYKFGNKVECIPSKIPMPDETDRKFYDVAKAAGAIIITGNAKHYPEESFIKEPAEFLLLLG